MKSFTRTLMLAMAVMLSWAVNAQTLDDYAFETGVDASRWVSTVATSGTQLLGTGQDDQVSSVTNIGFTFTMGGQSYTQFSATSNGWLKLGSVVASTTTIAGQFSSSYLTGTSYVPKISG